MSVSQRGRSSNEMDGGSESKRARYEMVSHQETKASTKNFLSTLLIQAAAVSARLEWRIDNFEKLMKLFHNGRAIVSNRFLCEAVPECVWELHIYPNGKREEDAGHVSFFLRQVGLANNAADSTIMTEFQIYCVKNNDSGMSDSNNSERISICRDTKDFVHQQGRGKFQVSREKMMQAIRPEREILLICDVEYFPPGSKFEGVQTEQTGESTEERRSITPPPSTSHLRDLFHDNILTDTELIVKHKDTEDRLRVHRCILGLHSPVFRQMFSNDDMQEARTGRVTINDHSVEAVRAFVEWMYESAAFVSGAEYTKRLQDMFHMHTEEILALADKYDLQLLKCHCESLMAQNLSPSNVCDRILFADTYMCTTLRNACIRLMREKHAEVVESSEWSELKAKHPQLSTQLLECILCNKDIKGGLDTNAVRVARKGSRVTNVKVESDIVIVASSQPSEVHREPSTSTATKRTSTRVTRGSRNKSR